MNISEALIWGQKKLEKLENPKFEAEVLLASTLGKDRIFLKTFPEKNLDEKTVSLYKKFIQKRSENFPVAQILEYKNWNGFRIWVNEHVLIPRDETETLCLKIQAFLSRQNDFSTVLDIGTGSGCISLFLKKNFPHANVLGVDISEKALEVAQKNADLHDLNIDFRHSDLLSAFEKGDRFDIIVANLPYVPERYRVTSEVEREPAGAIFSGEDGLDLLRRLAHELADKDIKFRVLFLEFLPFQKESIAAIFEAWNVEFLTDEGGDVFFAKVS